MSVSRPSAWDRWAWAAGIVFVVALVAETVISVGIPINQNDSAAKIARELAHHHHRMLVVCTLSAIYAAAFPVYLVALHQVLTGAGERRAPFAPLILVGGTVMVTLHAVSDVAIVGMLGAKVATWSAAHDPGISYTFYLLTFALDSIGDVFGGLFALAAGALLLRDAARPRWLGWMAVVFGVLLVVQGPTLGGVVTDVGLAVDGLGFVLFLIFVAASSVLVLRRPARA